MMPSSGLVPATTLGAMGLLVTVTGCSASTDDVTIADLPAKSIATWSMPTDAYVEDDNANDGYALDLLMSACLAESGENYPVAWQPAGKDSDPTTNPARRWIFTESVASEYGYHRARVFDLPGFEGAKARFEAGTAGCLRGCPRGDPRIQDPAPRGPEAVTDASTTHQADPEHKWASVSP